MMFIFPLPVPIKAKYLVSVYVLIEIWNGFSAMGGGIAHMAHLGGAFIGAVWVLLDNRGMIDRMLQSLHTEHHGHTTSTIHKDEVKEATFYDINSTTRTPSPTFDHHQEIVDKILDKISKSGYENLTEEEKKILFEESKKLH
jgi:hypothetical protein